MKHKQLFFGFLCIALVLMLNASVARSQSIVTGGVAGVVTDPTGAVVVGAKLTLKNPATGETFTGTSAANGDYVFALLKPGNYALSTSKDGFKTVTQNLEVLVGTTVRANVALELGASSVTVEVTTEQGAQLQTETAIIATTFESKQIQEMPNPGGDVTYIAQTAPGVSMSTPAGGGYGNFSTFGLPGTANLFTINGNDYNCPFLNLNNSGSSNLLLGGNELQQVSIVNNAYTGQYGRQAGAQVDYTTKSGTNSWHGNAAYNWTGRYLNANDPLLKAGGGTTRPFENNNQWAASLGGPIIKDKLFVFANTEGLRYIFGTAATAFAPTPAFENYVLGNLPSVAPAAQLAQTVAFYQNAFKLWNSAPGISGASAVNGSCTNPGGFTPATLPAALAANACTQTWTDSASSGNKEWLLSARIDFNLSDKDQIFGRMKFDRGTQPTYTDLINPKFDTFSVQPQNEGQLNWTHVFTPTIINNFIGNILWYSAIFGSVQTNSPALSLFPGVLNFTDGSMTSLGFGSGHGGYNSGFLFPQGRNVTQWGLVDDLSITRGAHSFKMGFNWRRDDISDHTAAQLTVFPGVNTTLLGLANDQVASFTQDWFSISPVQPVGYYSLGFYFQDEYRATSKLRLQLTLRADRNSGGVCQHHCAGLPATPFYSLPHGADIPYNQSYLTGQKTIIPGVEMVAFQPRFGLTYSLNSKTVLRTGVGLFTDLYPGVILSAIDTNFPQVNQWGVPGGNLAWDLQPFSSTTFPTSGYALTQQCNSAFVSNYNSGGNLTTFLNKAPAACATTPSINDVTRSLSNPKYVEWNVEIQHALRPNTIVSFNYVGNRGYDELYRTPYLNGFGQANLPAAAPDPRVGNVAFLNSGAISNYNGLTISLKQNLWHGLTGGFNYTYSHSLDESSNGGINPFSIYYSVLGQVDPFNLRRNYASTDYDARHQISASYIYQLPFKSSHAALNALIGGWQVSGTQFWRTGYPFSVVDGAYLFGNLPANNLISASSSATILLQPLFNQRTFANVDKCVAPQTCFGVQGGVNSTAPFLFAPTTSTSPFASAVGRNAFRGPGFLGGDMSVRKEFSFRERYKFQIGLNAYNWFNHANYGAPANSTGFGSNFGAVILTQSPPTSPYGAFASSATDMRIAQLTAKLTF